MAEWTASGQNTNIAFRPAGDMTLGAVNSPTKYPQVIKSLDAIMAPIKLSPDRVWAKSVGFLPDWQCKAGVHPAWVRP